MEVVVSGCVFSSLVYELTNSKGDVEGLLIGQITSRTVNTVTDSQTQNVKHERVATIQGFIPFGRTYRFILEGIENQIVQLKQRMGSVQSVFDSGRVNDQTVLEEPNENGKTQKIIGWYKFRRNSQGLVSMREKVVHHNLVEKLSFTPAKEFILAIFTASMNKEMSNHKLDYCFCHSAHRRGVFEPIPVRILNLGDTSHSEYRLNSHASPSTSNIFYEVIDSYRNDFVDHNGYIQMTSSMHSMYITMMKKLQDLVEVVKGSEKGVLSLSEEVDSRRRELKDVQLQLASRNEPCNVDEKRPLQSCAIHNSSQENDNVHRSTNPHGSETNAVFNDAPASGFDLMEVTHDSSISNEKPEIVLNKQYNTRTGSSSKQRKQFHPTKITSCVSSDYDDDDDDVTDDETQTYSLNGHSEGSGQKEMNTESQSIESSPVF